MERDKLLGTMDAKVWTDEFMATRARLGDKEFDHAMMLAWFANAIMAGFDEANRRAQRDLDAEREKVKRLSTCGTDHSTPWWQVKCEDLEAQLATLQAQLADRDAMILQMGKQAARLAKDGIAAKAQLRQVEGERQALRQLVEALPVVDGRMDVECGACYYIRSFVAGQYGIVCGLITEQSTAMAIKTLLEYRATLAAQDAKDAPLTAEQRDIRDCCEKPHDCKWGGLGGCGYEGRKP